MSIGYVVVKTFKKVVYCDIGSIEMIIILSYEKCNIPLEIEVNHWNQVFDYYG